MERAGLLLLYLLCIPAPPSYPINPFEGKSFDRHFDRALLNLTMFNDLGGSGSVPIPAAHYFFFFLCYELHLLLLLSLPCSCMEKVLES